MSKQLSVAEILSQRHEKLKLLKEDSKLLHATKIHYRNNPWDFINDWGMTFNPRLLEEGGSGVIPFILWPRQEEFLKWVEDRWNSKQRGVCCKSRDCGVTWLCVGYAVCKWCFVDGFNIIFGSCKEEKLDKKGDMSTIFEKIRFFIRYLPKEFLPHGFRTDEHMLKRIIKSPKTNATIIGEIGDQIGRSGRCSIAFVDEAAFIEHQMAVDAALSNTTIRVFKLNFLFLLTDMREVILISSI